MNISQKNGFQTMHTPTSIFTRPVYRYSSLTILMLAALLFYGCPDRNFPNPNSADPETAGIQSLVTGVEASMRNGIGFYLYGTSIIGREAYYFGGDDPRYMAEYKGGALDPGGPFNNNNYIARYNVIATARALLRAAETLPAEERRGVEGFAKTVIAYQLLIVLNQLNDNGIKIGFSPNPSEFPFVPKAEGFREINRLLDEAHAALTASGTRFGFRLSSGFAGFDSPTTFARFNRALRARVAAYQGDYAACLSALSQSFLREGDTPADMNLGVYHVYSTATGDATNPLFEPAAQAVRWWAHPSVFRDNEDTATDRRLQKLFRRALTSNYGVSSTFVVNVFQSNVAPIPIIRNEELLLLRAEANILGTPQNLAAATADINRVRRAAGLSDIPTLPDREMALNRLIYERRYSLFCEGHRWIDMRRFPTRPGTPNPNNLPGRLNELPIDRPGDRIIVNFERPLADVPRN